MPQFCESCGKPLPSRDSFVFQGKYVCGDCLDRIRRPADTRAPAVSGVGGWLLLFCLLLGVVTPTTFVYGAVRQFLSARAQSYSLPSLMTYALLNGAFSILLGTFAVFAAVALWRERPTAPRTTRAFLVAYLVYGFVAAMLPGLAGVPAWAYDWRVLLRDTMLPAQTGFWIWWLYLNYSRRVKATYAGL